MYCWTHSPKPSAAPASIGARVADDEAERRHQSAASNSTAPQMSVITISALPLRVQRTSDGGAAMNSAVATHAILRESTRSTSMKFRHRKATKQASVTALSATTLDPAARKTTLVRYTSGTPL